MHYRYLKYAVFLNNRHKILDMFSLKLVSPCSGDRLLHHNAGATRRYPAAGAAAQHAGRHTAADCQPSRRRTGW